MSATYQPLADQLNELCHKLNPESARWSSEIRAKFNALYSRLSVIDERKVCKP
jgi:hypothetical protein